MLDTQTIKEYGYALGFDLVRISSAEEFPEAKRVIKERIERGLMDGLPWFTAERADVSCHPDVLLPEARSIIALAMCYLTEQPTEHEGNEPRGRISRYAWGDDYHDIIKPRLQQFAAWLREYACDELGNEVETRLFVDTGRMVDRAVAQRAGLGWYGKNTNILTKRWGSWVFLAEIVTNLPLVPDEPLKANCGNCEICLHACPTGALPNPYELDNTRCISFLTIELRGSIPLELRPLMGNLIFGCDICQEVCPVNKVAEKRLLQYPQLQYHQSGSKKEDQSTVSQAASQQGTVYQQNPKRPGDSIPDLRNGAGNQFIPVEAIGKRETTSTTGMSGTQQASGRFRPHEEFRPRPGTGSAPELIPLLALTEEEFRGRFRRSPIKRTKRRGLLRNVCVALGNIGDQQAVPALIGALHDNEPLVRGHAAWALGRIGGEQALAALHTALGDEKDWEVQQEIRCALTGR